MITFRPSARLLVALFDLLQANADIDLFVLSETAGLNLYRTLAELDFLARRGLADARRLRLTAAGLAVAVALDRRSRLEVVQRKVPSAGTVVSLRSRTQAEQLERPKNHPIERELVA